MKKENNYNKEEWGGWKIVSKMLDHPDKLGIYPTSQCYQELYEFVMEQKEKARQAQKKEIIKLIEGELDYLIHRGEGENKMIPPELLKKLKGRILKGLEI